MLRENNCIGRRLNSAAVDETQQNRESVASAEARSILRGVKESSNAYPPLKSIAERLWLILDNCKVYLPHANPTHDTDGRSRKRR